MVLKQQPFVGFENELVGYHLVLGRPAGHEWKLCKIQYGVLAARSAGTSRVGNIPYAEIQVEGASSNPTQGTPEHVGGPTRVPGNGQGRQRANSFDCAAEALGILRKHLRQACSAPCTPRNGFTLNNRDYFFLSKILDAYNRELEQLAAGAGANRQLAGYYRKFKLKANDQRNRRWAIAKRSVRQADATTDRLGTQANVEVPFSTIGQMGNSLSQQLEARSRAAFEYAQRRAGALVNRLRFAQSAPTSQYLTGRSKSRTFESAIRRRTGIRSGELDAAVSAVNAYVDSPSKERCEQVRNAIARWMKKDPKEWKNRGAAIWDGGLAAELRSICKRWGVDFSLDEAIGRDENTRLNSLFTLYYYAVYIHNENAKSAEKIAARQAALGHTRGETSEGRATANKDRWGLLPKVEWNDLLDQALRPADRAFLKSWTDNAGNWSTLKGAMNSDLEEIQKAGVADPSLASWTLDRDEFHEKVFKGGGAISSSGKPLPVSQRQSTHRTGNGKSIHFSEPMIVFEARAVSDLAHQANVAMQSRDLSQLLQILNDVQRAN